MDTTAEHVGMARMEAATWKRTPRPARPRRQLPRRVWWAFAGRFAIFVLAMTVLCGVAQFGTPEPSGVVYKKKFFAWSAIEPGTGRLVPPSEYVSRALAAHAELTTNLTTRRRRP